MNFDELPLSKKVERWEQVIRVLRGLTRHQRRRHWDMAEFLDERSFGTVGCAAGFCSLDPWFRRRGFKSKLIDGGWGLQDVQWEDFFGGGVWSIFNDRTQRPVGKVIREIQQHIKMLRSEPQ